MDLNSLKLPYKDLILLLRTQAWYWNRDMPRFTVITTHELVFLLFTSFSVEMLDLWYFITLLPADQLWLIQFLKPDLPSDNFETDTVNPPSEVLAITNLIYIYRERNYNYFCNSALMKESSP